MRVSAWPEPHRTGFASREAGNALGQVPTATFRRGFDTVADCAGGT